jgi:predicted O-linked N-acetylglucosamine transferase (SPINDLY family)
MRANARAPGAWAPSRMATAGTAKKMNAKPGRNDPCACGSGRKFKQCCLNRSAPSLDLAELAFNQGTQLMHRGQWGDALTALRSALQIRPRYFEAQVNLGNVLRSLGNAAESLACYREAKALRPDIGELDLNIGASLVDLGRYDEAIACYRTALVRRPEDARLHNNLAMALRRAERPAEAEASFRAALAREPGTADAQHGLATLLLALGRLDEAEAAFRAALRLDPGNAEIWHGLSDVLHDQGRTEESLSALRRAIDTGARAAETASGLIMKLLYFDAVSPEQVKDAHERFAQRFEQPLVRVGAPAHRNAPDPARRLRLGYVSADLRRHSVAFFLEPVLAHHDHERFEIFAYSVGPKSDAVTDRLRAGTDHWLDATALSDAQLADRIRADGIDVLVDLSGHTIGNRLLAFARRPAPVQLSWIGYPHPSGLRAIGHFVTDPIASPGSEAGGGDSGLLRLAGAFSCYQPPPYAPEPSPVVRPPGGAVLGSFNNARKISERTVALWARALRETSAAHLLLKDRLFGEASYRAAMRRRFARHGIGEDRLDLRGRPGSDEAHFAAYAGVDVALDAFPYGGVTTTCEALWMGVPVVSLAGDRFASRMGATLLTAAGHPEWVAHGDEEFARKVDALVRDAGFRGQFRRDARSQLSSSRLLDAAAVTRDFEAAVRRAWMGWCLGAAVPA